MKFFGYPVEIWAACGVAVLIRLQANNRLTWFSAITTTLIALFSGILLYQPILGIFALSESWATVASGTIFYAERISDGTSNIKGTWS